MVVRTGAPLFCAFLPTTDRPRKPREEEHPKDNRSLMVLLLATVQYTTGTRVRVVGIWIEGEQCCHLPHFFGLISNLDLGFDISKHDLEPDFQDDLGIKPKK